MKTFKNGNMNISNLFFSKLPYRCLNNSFKQERQKAGFYTQYVPLCACTHPFNFIVHSLLLPLVLCFSSCFNKHLGSQFHLSSVVAHLCTDGSQTWKSYHRAYACTKGWDKPDHNGEKGRTAASNDVIIAWHDLVLILWYQRGLQVTGPQRLPTACDKTLEIASIKLVLKRVKQDQIDFKRRTVIYINW